MAGQNYILDKAWPVLSTYNSSAAAGVTPHRLVKLGAGGTIDLNATASVWSIGVVMDTIDQAKVATGKVYADVRMQGIAKIFVTTATSLVIGSKVMAGTAGGVLLAATAANFVVGIIVGLPTGAVAAGDLVDVMLTPGLLVP